MKFRVELCFTQHSRASLTIHADSPASATQRAEGLEADDVEWHSLDGEVVVLSVEPIPAKRTRRRSPK